MIFLWLLLIVVACALICVCYRLKYPFGYVEMQPIMAVHGTGPSFPQLCLLCLTDFRSAEGCVKWWNRELVELAKKCPVLLIQVAHRYTAMLTRPKNVKPLLTDTETLTKPHFFYDFMKPWIGEGLLTSTGAMWHRQRRLLTPAFHYQALSNFAPVMNQAAKTLTVKMKKICEENDGKPWDIQESVISCTMDIIMQTAMGVQADNATTLQYHEALNRFSEILSVRSFTPWLWFDWVFNLTPTGRKAHKLISYMHAFRRGIVENRVNERAREQLYNRTSGAATDDLRGRSKRPQQAFLDMLLDLKDAGEISEKELAEHVDTFIFTGHDTTGQAMVWCIYRLALHEDIQQKVRQEVIEELEDNNDEVPSSAALNRLGLLDRFIKETLRLHPAVPIIGRQLDHPLEIETGMILTRGVIAGVDLVLLHRQEEHFPEPLTFDPGRFLPENVSKRDPFAYMPFSAGQRNCIGQRFAMLELKIVLCHLVRNFEFSTSLQPEDIGMVYTSTNRPLNPVMLTVKPIK